jgi:hypothetical protein
MRLIATVARAVLGLALAALMTGQVRAEPVAPLRVLFVGNSLTYTNDLPGMVAALGNGAVETGMIAVPNAGLEDHWRDAAVQRELASGRWDVVVMQQGPSSLRESRAELMRWSVRLADAVRGTGGRPALLMVWPPEDRRQYLGTVIESYQAAARACSCELLPAGVAWREAWKRDRSVRLYGRDGFHPGVGGSYLAALVVWGLLTGSSVSSSLIDAIQRSGS